MRRAILLMGAVGSMMAALLLVVNAGLPERTVFTGQSLPGERPIAPEPGAIAPPFEHPLLYGDTIRLLELRGSPVIVNFWATWCVPCRVEMPILQAIYNQHRERGLRVLAVNLGEPEDVVQDWVEGLSLTFDIMLDEQQQVATMYQLRGTPSTYIVAPNGVITEIFYGPATESQLQAAIAPYVSEPT